MAVTNVIGKQIVDLTSDSNYYFEVAPQGDSQARYVDITVLDNGVAYTIPTGSTIILEGKNAGEYNIFNSCVLMTGTTNVIRVPLTNGVLSFAGVGRYSVAIYNGSNYIISFPFNIVVTEAPYDVVALQASDSYEALNQVIAKAADSNRWVVQSGVPSTVSADIHKNDYLLDTDTGYVYYANENISTGNLQWDPLINPTTNKQVNIMEKTYVRYALDDSGTGFSEDPVVSGVARSYVGFYSTTNVENPSDPSLDINIPSNYKWASMRTGIDATNTYTEYKEEATYSPTPPVSGWTRGYPTSLISGGYLWIKTHITFNDGTSAEYCTVSKNGRGVASMSIDKDDGDVSHGEKKFHFVYDDPAGTTTSPISVYNGTDSGFDTPVIGITPSTGKSSVSITSTGPNTSKKFDFEFDMRGAEWKSGTAITGTGTVTSTTFTENNSIVGDMYLNESTGVIYKCTGTTVSSSTWVETFTVSVVSNINELNNTVRINGTVYKDAGTPPARKSAVTLTSTDSIFVAPASQDNYIYQIKIYTPVQGLYPLTAPVSIAANSFSITLTFWTKDIPATVGLPVSVEVIRKSV